MATAAAIISIIVALMAGGTTTWQVLVQGLNGQTKAKIMSLVNKVNNAISSKRLSLTKIINALTSKSNQATLNLLYNNPVISKSLQELNADQDFLADISARQNLLEQEIASKVEELRSLGYANTIQNFFGENEHADRVKKEIDEKQAEYDRLTNEAKSYNPTVSRSTSPVTSDIDAVSQNVKGGLK